MSKSATYSAAPRPRGPATMSAVSDGGVTITASAAVPHIDLASVLARRDLSMHCAAPAISGATAIVAGREGARRTIALSDGTRITFASAVSETA